MPGTDAATCRRVQVDGEPPPGSRHVAVQCVVELVPTGALLDGFVEHIVVATLPRAGSERISLVQLPALATQVVFALEEGRSILNGTPVGVNTSASLFLSRAHLRALPMPSTVRDVVAISLHPAGSGLLGGPAGLRPRANARIPLERIWGHLACDLLPRLASECAHRRAHALKDALLARRPHPQQTTFFWCTSSPAHRSKMISMRPPF